MQTLSRWNLCKLFRRRSDQLSPRSPAHERAHQYRCRLHQSLPVDNLTAPCTTVIGGSTVAFAPQGYTTLNAERTACRSALQYCGHWLQYSQSSWSRGPWKMENLCYRYSLAIQYNRRDLISMLDCATDRTMEPDRPWIQYCRLEMVLTDYASLALHPTLEPCRSQRL